jgi:hypothetical protein
MNILEKFVGSIRKKSREEWERIPREAYADTRSWIQANPERAAGAAFVVGVVLVLAFKIVFTVAFLSFAAALVVWQIALPEAEMPKTPAPSQDDPNS